MLCPFAISKPVRNHGGPMAEVRGLVLHVQEGNGSLAGWFDNPASGVSAHFWAAKDGALEQYVEALTQTAWAEAAGNPYYLSVETEGFVGEPLTAEQVATVAALLVWTHQEYSAPLIGPVAHGARGFTQHCNPDGTPDPAWGNHVCPGPIRLAQMPAILAVANSTTTPGGTDVLIAGTPSGKGYYLVKPDGSVFAYGDAVYKGGINNAGPGGTSAMPAGDSCTGLAVCQSGGYWLTTAKGNVYAFGGAPYLGHP